jgi:hypothetical protein
LRMPAFVFGHVVRVLVTELHLVKHDEVLSSAPP